MGLWIAASLLGSGRLSFDGGWETVIIAGFILAVLNTVLKPFLVFLSLPAIIITLGLFMLFLNGAMILLVGWLYEPLNVANLWVAIVAGVIVGLVNYLVTRILEDFDRK